MNQNLLLNVLVTYTSPQIVKLEIEVRNLSQETKFINMDVFMLRGYVEESISISGPSDIHCRLMRKSKIHKNIELQPETSKEAYMYIGHLCDFTKAEIGNYTLYYTPDIRECALSGACSSYKMQAYSDFSVES